MMRKIYAGAAKPEAGGGGGSSTKYGASIDNFLGDVDANGVLQAPSGEATNLVFTGVKGIGSGLLNEKFYRVMNIASVSFPDLESVTESNALAKCFCPTENANLTADSLLTSISFPKLASVTGSQAFSYCFARNKNLKSVTFPALTTINGNRTFEYIFSKSGIESVSFPELTTVGSYQAMSFAFHMCKSISTITFPKLNSLTDMCFQSCFQWSTVSSVSFPALTSTSFGGGIQTYFNSMLQGVTGCTVHFPSNLQSVIGSWSDVTAGFGGTNTTVLFDLPATE